MDFMLSDIEWMLDFYSGKSYRNSFHKSAITSRARLRPLRGALLKTPALLVVADFTRPG